MQDPAGSTHLAASPGGAAGAREDAGQQEPLQCLMCKGTQYRPVFAEFGIDIVRCADCGHIFTTFRGDPHYTGFWGAEVKPGEHYYWSKARARMHRDFFNRFIEGRSGRLLDMGSGLGFFLKSLARYPNWEGHGCEISPAAVKHAREHLGLRNVICSPLQHADLPRGSFDVITMWDVLDHILHPDPLLRHCHALLKDDGTFFIRTPNVTVQLLRARLLKATGGVKKGRMYLQGSDHMHHYSAESITKLLQRNGFVDVQFLHLHPIYTGEGWKTLLVNPAKRVAFHVLRALAVCTGGRVNLNNLFVVARKGPAVPSA
jgi:2-polyprenyl-3-methyl-5-hydroxy-6-metoxy-1,4-benzoquinol methylase